MAIRTAAFAALGTLAIAGTALVPATTAAHTTPSTGEHSVKNVAIKPGTLDRGQRPHALYRQGRRIYDGKRSFKIRGPKRLGLEGLGHGGYIMIRYGQYHGHLWQIRPHRKARRLGFVAQAGYNGGDEYTVSDAGNRLAITEPERTGQTMTWVRALPSGKKIRFRFLGDLSTHVVAFPKYRVLFSTFDSTFWYAPKRNELTTVVDTRAYVASRDENRMVVRGEKGEDHFQLVELGDPANVLASWEHGRPLVISPDGRYFLAKDGKHKLQIRRLADGRRVRTFSAAGRIKTASARWESRRRVLFTAKGSKVAANVRCTVGGKCERTTRLVKRPRKLGIDWP